ncbi:MAG TPA: protocatechuate 4,5-dioxygenase subunit alpha [Bryobacteraceae bacterium]|nr:protocatechuate 4,5-dioxygenase subunit alpha [Bryobacteraceae bacterium]
MDRSEAYADIPGTYLFDKRACAKGYYVNMFCMSMMKEENRKAFLADGWKYMERYPLTQEQRQAIMDRNWLKLIQEGGNIYYVSKLGATCGCTFEDMAAAMSGMTKEKYRAMMLSGGRSIQGNRSKTAKAGSDEEK